MVSWLFMLCEEMVLMAVLGVDWYLVMRFVETDLLRLMKVVGWLVFYTDSLFYTTSSSALSKLLLYLVLSLYWVSNSFFL